MSRQSKKPAEQIAKKVKSVNLLPDVFKTDPNKKMLDSTVDVMSSKGQLLPFQETYGQRTASNRIDEFFKIESDPARRESQSNNMLVLKNSDNDYLGKVSYYDIENYFRVKGAELFDGVMLDKNINILSLPIDHRKIIDFNSYYWLAEGLPACRIHLDSSKFTIDENLIGQQFARIKDDLTGKDLDLQNGMVLFFTGAFSNPYVTTDLSAPIFFIVYGVSDSIKLIDTRIVERRAPYSYYSKILYDRFDNQIYYPRYSWDGALYDGSLIFTDPEYVVQENYQAYGNHWQMINSWYHISLIRTVAKFIGVKVEDIARPEFKGRRPIICFDKDVELYNWPKNIIVEIKSILPGSINQYQNKPMPKDLYGHVFAVGDRVVFEDTGNVYRITNISSQKHLTFILDRPSQINDGALITASSKIKYNQVICKANGWKFAQNRVEKNQTPKFEFYLSKLQSDSPGVNLPLSSFNETSFVGGIILGFKEGDVSDPVLEKNIDSTSIIFDNNQTNEITSPQKLKFVTDIDKEFYSIDLTTADQIFIKGPYGYKAGNKIIPFYQPRKGLDFTKQIQDFLYYTQEEEAWSAETYPPTEGFNIVHIFYDDVEKYKFYYATENYGLIRFSSKSGPDDLEQLLPLISGQKAKIVCHDLPAPITFYEIVLSNNITRPVVLTSPYISNNGITNGVIEIDLSSSVLSGSAYIDNRLATPNTKLVFTLGNQYKTAIVRPIEGWYFIQNFFVHDVNKPLYYNYDYTLMNTPVNLGAGALSYTKELSISNRLFNRLQDGDKIGAASVLGYKNSQTAPLSLTVNPLNEALSTISYYSLHKHATSIDSQSSEDRKIIDPDRAEVKFKLGGGTLLKHNDPLAKAAITATNLPYDINDLLIKQGKHYDVFLNQLKTEITNVINSTNHLAYTSLEILNQALSRIYILKPTENTFWAHSNMIGWGNEGPDYSQKNITVGSSLTVNLADVGLKNISCRAGKELILHLSFNRKVLMRGVDYWLEGNHDEYTRIRFKSSLLNQLINVRQWQSDFKSMVPASLAKIGLAAVYQPEIYLDSSFDFDAYYIVRHDGTRYYLDEGIDGNNYPNSLTDQYLFEYEKAVWSSIAYDVENNSHSELIENQPGYFRTKINTWRQTRRIVNTDVTQWLLENNITIMNNDSYSSTDGFTFKYQLGTGDDDYTVTGSWRAVYKYLYDTDRPHSHPWEMLGYTIKPAWWDTYYSWTNTAKRAALEKALRTGLVSDPSAAKVANPSFARVIDLEDPEAFPVDSSGNLLPPSDLTWLLATELNPTIGWEAGDMGPVETVFLNTHRGLASEIKRLYLISPAQYVNSNWVPGQVVRNTWNNKLDRTTGYWQQSRIEHDYHRKQVSGQTVYTGGIESLYIEFCVLNNKDYVAEVINKFYMPEVKKEFLLGGFTNKENVRIKAISLNNNQDSLYVLDDYYDVRTVKHYTEREVFYSGVRITSDVGKYSITGFNTELGFFPYYAAVPGGATRPVIVGDLTVQEKIAYEERLLGLKYGSEFTDKQDVYDFLIGYGKYLETAGFIFEEVEGDEIRNFQLSAKQFIFWTNNKFTGGNLIDLNPLSNEIKITSQLGHLDNLEGTNENIGLCVDRQGQSLYSKDLLVFRDDTYTSIKPKNRSNPVYGIKLSFSTYETVAHLSANTEFGDVYFDASQGVGKLSFVIGGKKSQNWAGNYYVPGYVFKDNSLLPNYDSMADVGRTLLDFENTIFDQKIVDAARAQFGLNKNPELRELFLQEDNEVAFKNSITFNKGTKTVFDNLQPLTHPSGSSTQAFEEYMIRIGEFGNTKNIEYYEFELNSADIKSDYQVIRFSDDEIVTDNSIIYISENSSRWVDKPYNKNLRFKTFDRSYSDLRSSGPIISGDADYNVSDLKSLEDLYTDLVDIWSIPAFDKDKPYKIDDQFRYKGNVHYTRSDLNPASWTLISNVKIVDNQGTFSCDTAELEVGQFVFVSGQLATETGMGSIVGYVGVETKYFIIKTNGSNTFVLSSIPGGQAITTTPGKTTGLSFNDTDVVVKNYAVKISEPWLPNIYIKNYYKSNPDLTNQGLSAFKPGTWQVLQTMELPSIEFPGAIKESCPGLDDASQARITLLEEHKLAVGDYVLIVNAELDTSSVNGIWKVVKVEKDDAGKQTRFYIDTRIIDKINTGKVFTFKPVRFKNAKDLNKATGSNAGEFGYVWGAKYNPFVNSVVAATSIEEKPLKLQPSPSGYDRTYPIAIIDDGLEQDPLAATYDYGNYEVYSIVNGVPSSTPVKQELLAVDPSDIEQLIVYDHTANQTVAKFELFDPKKLIIPESLKDDIDVISRVDPAKYNRTTDKFKSVYTSLGWYEEYVGRRWWDTSTTNFNDYESGDISTRIKYWGSTVDDQAPEVYEWTKSPVPPSQWQELVTNKKLAFGQLATGEVYVDKTLNVNNYHWVEEAEYVNGVLYTTYYFWVKNKKSIAQESTNKRTYSVDQLSKVLLKPQLVGISWWAPLTSDSILIKNVKPYLNDSSTVVQIKKKPAGQEKHQQWLFLSEANPLQVIPEWVHTRFKDSISSHILYNQTAKYLFWSPYTNTAFNRGDIVRWGVDPEGNAEFYLCKKDGTLTSPDDSTSWILLEGIRENIVDGRSNDKGYWDRSRWDRYKWDYDEENLIVFSREQYLPDAVHLHRFNLLGNDVRPYAKSWFNNVTEARRTFIKKLNEIMTTINISTLANWGNTILNKTNHRVGDQSYDITKYWYYADFVNPEFDSTRNISFIVNSLSQLYELAPGVGDYIKVTTGVNLYSIYRKNADGSFTVLFEKSDSVTKSGTIQFSDLLFDESGVSQWDGFLWDASRFTWDGNINSVFNAIVDSLRKEIFVGVYQKYYSVIICAMLRYVLSEQKNVDWIVKSSTIQPINIVSSSDQAGNYLRRNQVEAILSFFNSLKSYRDKPRRSTINKIVLENVNVEITDSVEYRTSSDFETITTDITLPITINWLED